MKNDLLSALLMISIDFAACNTTAATSFIFYKNSFSKNHEAKIAQKLRIL